MSERKKILVTGGAGYIGSHTVVELYNSGFEPIILDDFRNSEEFIIDRIQKIINNEVILYKGACQDADLLQMIFEAHEISGVIHFAAYKAVGESVKDPLMYYENNIGSLLSILRCLEVYKVKNFVFSSSCSVYGDHPKLGNGITEEASDLKPQSPYANTKLIGEQIITDWKVNQPDTNVCLLRYFNPVGAHESARIGELPLGVPNNLLPFITQTAAGIREELTIFGNDYNTEDGTCIRDYIHVVDLAKAHVKSLEWLLAKNGVIDVFNVGTGKGSSVLEIVTKFEELTKVSLNWSFGPRRTGDVPVVFADNKKVKEYLKWTPEYTVDDAIVHAWEWQKSLE